MWTSNTFGSDDDNDDNNDGNDEDDEDDGSESVGRGHKVAREGRALEGNMIKGIKVFF